MTFDDNLLSDAHIHLSDFAARFLAAHDVLTIVSTATPEECKTARQLAAANTFLSPAASTPGICRQRTMAALR